MKNTPGGRFVVLDFETTGLSPRGGARVIEVSAREVVDGRVCEEFLTFVDPGIEVSFEITQITGITTEIWDSGRNPTTRGEPSGFPNLLAHL
jgi:DNA polymerase-3 subunit epsilon